MEIEQLRKEISDLLESLVNHCDRYTGKRHLTSLEVNHVLAKTNNLQERLSVLKYLLEQQHSNNIPTESIATFVEEEKIPVVEIIETQEPMTTPVLEEIITPLIKESPQTSEIQPKETNITSDSLSEQLQQTPIAKLVDAFNLNDRYLYANELFNKDMSAFNGLIKSIDSCSSLDEAQTVFNQAGVTNNWDIENQLVIDFMSLIERRF